MQLTDIALNSLRRRKGRMIFLVLGLAIGVATVVALVAITDTMQTDIAAKMERGQYPHRAQSQRFVPVLWRCNRRLRGLRRGRVESG